MNLTSCTNCGVVLNKDHLKFPRLQDCFDEFDAPDTTKVEFVDYSYVPYVQCPVCGEQVLESSDG